MPPRPIQKYVRAREIGKKVVRTYNPYKKPYHMQLLKRAKLRAYEGMVYGPQRNEHYYASEFLRLARILNRYE